MSSVDNVAVPHIACVILNWNGRATIRRCVESVRSSNGVRVEVVIVDNGSLDGSLEELRGIHSDIHFIMLERNLGLAATRNMGIRWAMERELPLVSFLDDDATVDSTTLKKLAESLIRNPDSGVITPRIYSGDGTGVIWYDGGRLVWFGRPAHRNMWRGKDEIGSGEIVESAFATGCCMMIRTEVLKRVGSLDEEFFVYGEDADLSFRVRAGGFKVLHLPTASAWHTQSSDTKANKGKWFRDYYVTRNNFLLFRKHYVGMRRFKASLCWFIIGGVFPLTYYLLTLQPLRAKAVLSGVIDYMNGRFGKRFA